ncbi:hypothetical protein ACSSS7_007810 [Eimeria intestinalis]
MQGGGIVLSWLRRHRSAVLLQGDRHRLVFVSPLVGTQTLQQPHRCRFCSSPALFEPPPRQNRDQRSSSSSKRCSSSSRCSSRSSSSSRCSSSSSSSIIGRLQQLNLHSKPPSSVLKCCTVSLHNDRKCLSSAAANYAPPEDNERVSFEEAESSDLWFHADGIPGGHVLLRKRGDLKSVSIVSPFFSETEKLFAADCAAYFSKNRQADNCRVVFAEAKTIRKPKGTPLGTVSITGKQRFLVGRPKRVALLVQAAIEERRQQNNKSRKGRQEISQPSGAASHSFQHQQHQQQQQQEEQQQQQH